MGPTWENLLPNPLAVLNLDNQIQWGSEIRPFEVRKHSKSGLYEGRISNGPNQDLV